MVSSSKSLEMEIKWFSSVKNSTIFKHSGLANAKTVSVQAGKGSGVVLANKQKNPSALVHNTVMKKEFSRMAKAVANQKGLEECSSCKVECCAQERQGFQVWC